MVSLSYEDCARHEELHDDYARQERHEGGAGVEPADVCPRCLYPRFPSDRWKSSRVNRGCGLRPLLSQYRAGR